MLQEPVRAICEEKDEFADFGEFALAGDQADPAFGSAEAPDEDEGKMKLNLKGKMGKTHK